jgi:hypothetical protein
VGGERLHLEILGACVVPEGAYQSLACLSGVAQHLQIGGSAGVERAR